jgi:hypothetical protein
MSTFYQNNRPLVLQKASAMYCQFHALFCSRSNISAA